MKQVLFFYVFMLPAAFSTRAADVANQGRLRGQVVLKAQDVQLLDDLERRSFRYFQEQTDARTGLTLDRAAAVRTAAVRMNDGPQTERVASIAATGFGLSAFCIAVDRQWISQDTARASVLKTLRFLANEAPQEHGWFYHFLDASTGKRAWRSEVSSIDSALLLAGVLTARQCLKDDPEIVTLATQIYDRVDFPWMLDARTFFFLHGWTPEEGFLRYHWDTYSELLILYALGIGSDTHPVSPDLWDTWSLPATAVGPYVYIGGGPLFIHQYSQAWLDLRDPVSSRAGEGILPAGARAQPIHPDYFANSTAATRAQQELFGKTWAQKFSGYRTNLWGVTASDSPHGYVAWGSTPDDSRIDGSIVPSAAGGSLMFAPDICIPALRAMMTEFGSTVYGRYGFADAFNPMSGWVSPYVLGIDAGITLLSAENLQHGMIWHWFMNNPEPLRALEYVGIRKPSDSVMNQIHIRASPAKGFVGNIASVVP